MARTVLIHGVGQQSSTAALETRRWLPSIVKGVLLSGHAAATNVAAELAASMRDNESAVGMAFYGDLFLVPGRQGDAEAADPLTLGVAESLAMALLQAATERGEPRLQAEASSLLSQAGPHDADTQAVGASTRSVIALLDGNAWLTARLFGLAQRARPDLLQVARYLTDDALRHQVQSRAISLVGHDTRLVIAHSLGSVIGWEVCQVTQRPLAMLITIGSPLGLDTVIYPRLRPSPPTFPTSLQRWTNVAHPDDVIAVEPQLAHLFPSPDSRHVEDFNPPSRFEHHSATTYLEQSVVGRAIAEALTDDPASMLESDE